MRPPRVGASARYTTPTARPVSRNIGGIAPIVRIALGFSLLIVNAPGATASTSHPSMPPFRQFRIDHTLTASTERQQRGRDAVQHGRLGQIVPPVIVAPDVHHLERRFDVGLQRLVAVLLIGLVEHVDRPRARQEQVLVPDSELPQRRDDDEKRCRVHGQARDVRPQQPPLRDRHIQQEEQHHERHEPERQVGVDARRQASPGHEEVEPALRVQRAHEEVDGHDLEQRLKRRLPRNAAERHRIARDGEQRRRDKRRHRADQPPREEVEREHRGKSRDRRDNAHREDRVAEHLERCDQQVEEDRRVAEVR